MSNIELFFIIVFCFIALIISVDMIVNHKKLPSPKVTDYTSNDVKLYDTCKVLPIKPKHSEAQLNALAVEYMVIQNCARQIKLSMELRKREIERQYEALEQLKMETSRLEIQSARVFKYLAPDEQAFILGYDDQGNYIQGDPNAGESV